MRLFIAVDLDDAARRVAAEAARQLAKSVEKSREAPRITWVRPENLHVTVRFLGEVPDVAALRASFEEQLSMCPFRASLSGIGLFPASGPPRVIWMGVAEGADALRQVYASLDDRLVRLGFLPEERSYTPHLTLGRVRESRGGGGAVVRRAVEAGSSGQAQWLVDHVTLFESRLGPHGPAHTVLTRAPLTS